MSIDGFNLAAIEDVPLTAVHVPRDELGTEAVHMLQQRLVRPDATVGALLLYGKLVIRESVRRIRPGKSQLRLKEMDCMTETTASDSSGQGKINVMFITRLCTMSFPLFIAIILLITRQE